MNRKKNLLIMLIILSGIFSSACMSSEEINTLGITISIGIDKSEKGYSITSQILNPRSIASQKASNESPIFTFTEEGDDIFETIWRVTTTSPRKVYVSHLRMIVFSEEIAKDGIQKILDFFMRDHEFRTDFFFVVARGCSAKDILETLTPLESVPGIEMHNSIQASVKSWAPTRAVKIIELVNTLLADGINPVLTGVKIVDNKGDTSSIDALKESDIVKLKLEDLSVFKKDKLVGWFNEDESKGYNYITGNVKNTVGHIKLDEKNKITFEIIREESKIKAYKINDKPAIKVAIDVKWNASNETGTFDLTSEQNTSKVNKLIEKEITNICSVALKKAAGELKSDIFGFGEEIRRTYPKEWPKIKDNWNDEFPKVPVTFSVKAQIGGLGESAKSIFTKKE